MLRLMAYSASRPHGEDFSMQAHEFMIKEPVTVSPDTSQPAGAVEPLRAGASRPRTRDPGRDGRDRPGPFRPPGRAWGRLRRCRAGRRGGTRMAVPVACQHGSGLRRRRRTGNRNGAQRHPGRGQVIETGIGGMSLVQELMAGYDALAMPSKRFTPPAQAIDVYNEEQTANYVNRY